MRTATTALFSAALAAMFIAPVASASEIFDASLSSPGVYWGTGNVNAGFDVLTTTNSDGSTLQLGLEALNRFIGPITPTSNDYTVTTSSGPRALWDFAFSVNTGTDPLSAYTYNLSITDDTTFKSASFDPTLLPDNGQANSSGVVCNGCAYNGANDGMQNAENLGFAFLAVPLNFDANAADTYTITLSANPKNGINQDPSVSINVAAQVPEPASLALMAAGLIGLGLISRRRSIRG